MKNNNKIFLVLFSILIISSGCETAKKTNKAQRGAGIGAVLGGVLGAVIANNTGGKSEMGAILGGVVGGVAGGLIGNKMDKQAKEIKDILPGAEVVKVNNGEGLQIILNEANSDGIKFSLNSSMLQPSARKNIEKLAAIFKENLDTNLTIIGHTDDLGTEAYNLQLSNKRSGSVAQYLSQNGVGMSRITTKGYGEAQPKAPNTSEANKAQNRRVEIFITANEKLINEAKNQSGQ